MVARTHLSDMDRSPDDSVVVRGYTLIHRVHEGPSVLVVPEMLQDFVHTSPEVLLSL